MGVFFLGFFIRLYACVYTSVINPDGTLYIHQARAIYYGAWDQLTTCSLGYVSAYPPLIAAAYPLFHDWVNAARGVSLLLSTLAIVPAYLLLKRFFTFPVSICGTLIFALTPTFIAGTADVIKEPFAWFFALLGLYLFVLHLDTKKATHAALSALSYLIAAWARPEVFLLFGVSCLFLLLWRKGKRLRSLLSYIIPFAAVILATALGAQWLGISLSHLYRVPEMLSKASDPLTIYGSLRNDLQSLISRTDIEYLKLFLEQARHFVWVVALATVLVHVVEAFFYPFFLFFLIGLKGLPTRLRNDTRSLYLALVILMAFALLYLHTLQSWFGTARFMYLIILPGLVIVTAGVEKAIRFLAARFKLNIRTTAAAMFCFLLLFGLGKNLRPRETDKLVFRELGESIARRESSMTPINILASPHGIRWVSFYANLHLPGAPCPEPFTDFREIIGKDYDEFVRNLSSRGIPYFVWEEKRWPAQAFDFMKAVNSRHFESLGTMHHRDTGKIVLFRFHAPSNEA
jgi:4-amino-4-deoxy-L-arabinose transferase-like glycosyltransferase